MFIVVDDGSPEEIRLPEVPFSVEVESATVGPWIQIDHDREHVPKLQAAIQVLERHGMIERHPTKGNPRNVRIVRVAK